MIKTIIFFAKSLILSVYVVFQYFLIWFCATVIWEEWPHRDLLTPEGLLALNVLCFVLVVLTLVRIGAFTQHGWRGLFKTIDQNWL